LQRNCLLKHVIKKKKKKKIAGRIEVAERREGEISSYWMTLRE